MNVRLIVWLVIYALMIVLIIILLTFSVHLTSQLAVCTNSQSPFCLTVSCPCNTNAAPCFGYSQRNGPREGTWYCSNAPDTLVDAQGKPV